MKKNDVWKKLSEAARRCPRQPDAPAELPLGFDTRVLARLRDKRSLPAELWLRLAWRMMPAGAAVLLVCWVAIPPAPAAWPTPDTAELTELLIQEGLPQ